MTMPPKPIRLEQWRFSLSSDSHQLVLVGIADGTEIESRPIVQRIGIGTYRARDGTLYTLNDLDPSASFLREMPRPSIEHRLRSAQMDLRYYQDHGSPSFGDLETAPELSNWILTADHYPVLIGTVKGHPYLPDGPITTSAVLWLSANLNCARTISRLYRLCRPLPLGA